MSQCITLGGPCYCEKSQAKWCELCQMYICRIRYQGHTHMTPDERKLYNARHALLNWISYHVSIKKKENIQTLVKYIESKGYGVRVIPGAYNTQTFSISMQADDEICAMDWCITEKFLHTLDVPTLFYEADYYLHHIERAISRRLMQKSLTQIIQ